jgi:hypothetical protein
MACLQSLRVCLSLAGKGELVEGRMRGLITSDVLITRPRARITLAPTTLEKITPGRKLHSKDLDGS